MIFLDADAKLVRDTYDAVPSYVLTARGR